MCMNFFILGGYPAFGAVFNRGDPAGFLHGLEPRQLWIGVVAFTGVGFVALGARLGARFLEPFLVADKTERASRRVLLTRTPLATAFVINVAASLLSPLQLQWAVMVGFLSPASQVFFREVRQKRNEATPSEAVLLPKSLVWITVGVVFALIFVVLFGSGIGSFEGNPNF